VRSNSARALAGKEHHVANILRNASGFRGVISSRGTNETLFINLVSSKNRPGMTFEVYEKRHPANTQHI